MTDTGAPMIGRFTGDVNRIQDAKILAESQALDVLDEDKKLAHSFIFASS